MRYWAKLMIVGLLIAVIFIPLSVHRPEYKEIWLYVWNRGEYRITDENGNYLIVQDGKTEGTIQILDLYAYYHSSEPTVLLYRVGEGEAFLLETAEEESYFSVVWDDLFLIFEGSGATQIRITPDHLSAEGTEMDYEISASAGRGKGRCYELRGSGESCVQIALEADHCVVSTTRDCFARLQNLRGGTYYADTDIPGGTSKIIYDIDQ